MHNGKIDDPCFHGDDDIPQSMSQSSLPLICHDLSIFMCLISMAFLMVHHSKFGMFGMNLLAYPVGPPFFRILPYLRVIHPAQNAQSKHSILVCGF